MEGVPCKAKVVCKGPVMVEITVRRENRKKAREHGEERGRERGVR